MLTQPRGGEPPQPGASTGVTQPEPDGPAPGGSRALARNVGAWAFAVDPTPNFDVMTYWRILLKRRWLILSVIVASLLVGIGITLMMRPYYTSRATLQIEREAARVMSRDADTQPQEQQFGDEFFQTQYGLLRSRSLAERVSESLGLARDDVFITQMGARAPDASLTPAQRLAARRSLVLGLISSNLKVAPTRGSRLVAVSFTSPNPALSARVANAFAENFIASNLDRRFESSSYARGFLERRIAQTRESLNQSERALVAYASANNITPLNDNSASNSSSGAQRSLDAASLEQMNAALIQARAARIQAEQQWRQASQARGLNTPEVLSNGTIQQLTNQRAALFADYQNRLRTYLPNYPDMVQLRAQITALDQQIAGQASAIRSSIQSQYQAALASERSLAGQVQSLQGAVLNLRNRSIQYTILQREVDTNRALYDGLLQRYREVGVAGGVTTNNISIVDRAEPAGRPSSPRPLINMGLAAFIGVVLAIVLAILLETLDQAIRTPSDVETKLRLPVLGSIPLLGKGLRPREALADPRSPLSEAYYSLRSALQFSTEEGFPRSLLVTSTRPGEGKSTTSYAVALNVARLGYRTLLMDADLRNPSLHKTTGLDNRRGLTNLLTSNATLREVAQEGVAHNLTIITCGPLPPNPAELLGTNRLKMIMRDAMSEYDVVILDGPPVMGLADAPMVAGAVNGALLVIEAGKTGRSQASAAARRLEMANAHVLGVALTKFDAREASYGYGYAYEYDYSYGGSGSGGGSRTPTVLDNLRGQAKRFTGRQE